MEVLWIVLLYIELYYEPYSIHHRVYIVHFTACVLGTVYITKHTQQSVCFRVSVLEYVLEYMSQNTHIKYTLQNTHRVRLLDYMHIRISSLKIPNRVQIVQFTSQGICHRVYIVKYNPCIIHHRVCIVEKYPRVDHKTYIERSTGVIQIDQPNGTSLCYTK